MFTGGWTVQENISQEQMEIFKEATAGLCGVGYEPKLVATQVVSGTNYCFICVATTLIPGFPKGLAKIIIFKGINAKPIITKIETVL